MPYRVRVETRKASLRYGKGSGGFLSIAARVVSLCLGLCSSVHAQETAPAVTDDDASTASLRPSGLSRTKPHHKTGAQVIEGIDYDTPRYEPAGFPLLGGDSDIGFELGAVGTLTRFQNGVRPYLWNMDLVLAVSMKKGPSGGVEIAQQNYLWQWDVPGLFGGKVRLNPAVSYQRTINQGYFGLGNASSGEGPPGLQGASGRYFQFISQQARVRQLTRIVLRKPYDLMVAAIFRYEAPSAYAGSKLALDATTSRPDGTPLLRGLGTLSLGALGTGLIYDTRDNEFFTHKGAFHQAGIKFVEGFPWEASVRYGEASAVVAWYVPVRGPVVLASRLVADFEFGHVPFYDLFTGGPFVTNEMPGGSSGVRGVPVGRYAGLIKFVGNVELRAMLIDFHMLQQSFRLGGNTFFDTGRVWEDYTFRSPRDGRGLGLKYGVGAGAYLQWGQAAVFRLEVAYSPDAVAENPSFPVGIYVEDGMMF